MSLFYATDRVHTLSIIYAFGHWDALQVADKLTDHKSEIPKFKKSGHLPVYAAIFGTKIAELFLNFGILRPAAQPLF